MEVLSVHHGGVVLRSVDPGAKLRHALFYGYSLGNREGPMHGVQLWVSVGSAIILLDRCGPEVWPGRYSDWLECYCKPGLPWGQNSRTP